MAINEDEHTIRKEGNMTIADMRDALNAMTERMSIPDSAEVSVFYVRDATGDNFVEYPVAGLAYDAQHNTYAILIVPNVR